MAASALVGVLAACGGIEAPSSDEPPAGAPSESARTLPGSSADGMACDRTRPSSCGEARICVSPHCGGGPRGTCLALDGAHPVCGCDGVTYFDALSANASGTEIAHLGVCEDAPPCGGPESAVCPAGLACRIDVQLCPARGARGRCWKLPSECAGHGRLVRPCAHAFCISECEAISSREPFDSGSACDSQPDDAGPS